MDAYWEIETRECTSCPWVPFTTVSMEAAYVDQSIDALELGETYSARVRLVFDDVPGDWSEIASIFIPCWEVESKVGDAGSWSNIATLPTDNFYFEQDGVTTPGKYYTRVRYVDGEVPGDWSTEEMVEIPSIPSAQGSKGGSYTNHRTSPRRTIHLDYTRNIGPDAELERLIEGRDEEQPAQEAQEATPSPLTAAHSPTFIDIAPIIESATAAYTDAIRQYTDEFAQQAAIAHQQRIEREQMEQARRLLEAEIARAKDEDEASALIMIMAVA